MTSGKTDEIKGRVKEAAAALTGDAKRLDDGSATVRAAAPVTARGRATPTCAQRLARDRAEPETIVDNLDQATQRFKEAVQDVETLVVAAQEESRGAHAAQEVRHVRKEIEQAIGPKRD